MKNATKKMKWAIMGFGLLLGLGLGLTLRADIKYFWLDHPTGRTNKNDPLSPLYSSPTSVIVGTHTDTLTISPTPTISSTITPSATLTFTQMAGTPTQSTTFSNTPTTTPSLTASPTPMAAGWPTVYGSNGAGGVVALGGNGYTSGGTDGFTQVTASEPGAVGYYQDVTLSCGAAGYAAGAVFSTGFWGASEPITQNATAYSSVSITVAIPPLTSLGGPASNPTLIQAGLSLVYQVTGLTYTSQTVVVSLDNFVAGGAQFMAPSTSTSSLTWYTAVVPLSVFEALCNSTTGVTATATDLQTLVGVDVQPLNFGQGAGPTPGAITTEIYVDGVSFVSAANATAPTGASGNDYSGLFADFENGAEDNWGGYWSTNQDGITSSSAGTSGSGPCTGGAGTLIAPTYTGYGPVTCAGDCWTVASYLGATDTVSVATGTPADGTPGYAAHFAGWFGNENGQYSGSGGSGNVDCGTTAGAGSGDFPYLNMTANTYPAGAATSSVDLSSNTFLTTLPAGGATGMSIELMPGANNGPNQVYGVGIGTTTNSASAGDMWFFQVATSSLTAGQWTQFIVSFPPDGTVGGTDASADSSGFHAQGSTDTELFFAQEQYSGYGAFSRNNVNQVEVECFMHNQPVDLYFDDIQFFSGSGPVAARHRAARVVTGVLR